MTFASLEEPSELEFADIKKKYAEIDSLYIDRGAIDAKTAWQERFGSGEFKYNIKLSPELESDISILEDEANTTSNANYKDMEKTDEYRKRED